MELISIVFFFKFHQYLLGTQSAFLSTTYEHTSQQSSLYFPTYMLKNKALLSQLPLGAVLRLCPPGDSVAQEDRAGERREL